MLSSLWGWVSWMMRSGDAPEWLPGPEHDKDSATKQKRVVHDPLKASRGASDTRMGKKIFQCLFMRSMTGVATQNGQVRRQGTQLGA